MLVARGQAGGQAAGQAPAAAPQKELMAEEVYHNIQVFRGVPENQFLATMDPAYEIIGTGDFDGDGKSDILWRNDSGEAYIWEMNRLQIKAQGSLGIQDTQSHIAGPATSMATARATSCGATTAATSSSGR